MQSEKLKVSETKKRTIFIIITQEQFWPKRKKFSLINHFLVNRPFLPTHRNLTSFCWFCRECLCHVQLSVIRARKGLSGRATPYEPNHTFVFNATVITITGKTNPEAHIQTLSSNNMSCRSFSREGKKLKIF